MESVANEDTIDSVWSTEEQANIKLAKLEKEVEQYDDEY